MKLQFFFVPVLDGEAEAQELNRFLASRRIVDIEKQLVHKETAAHWAVCVTYHEAVQKAPVKKSKIDYKEVLPPAEFAVYAALRDLRKQIAEKEAVQLYRVFSNAELAAMVTGRVTTMSGLQEIDGIGPASAAASRPPSSKQAAGIPASRRDDARVARDFSPWRRCRQLAARCLRPRNAAALSRAGASPAPTAETASCSVRLRVRCPFLVSHAARVGGPRPLRSAGSEAGIRSSGAAKRSRAPACQ